MAKLIAAAIGAILTEIASLVAVSNQTHTALIISCVALTLSLFGLAGVAIVATRLDNAIDPQTKAVRVVRDEVPGPAAGK